MPIDLTFDPAPGPVTFRLVGPCRPADFLAAIDAALADPRHDPAGGFLWDLSGWAADLAYDDIEGLVLVMQGGRDLRAPARQASVAPAPAAFGLGRMTEQVMSAEGLPSRLDVFRLVADARAFLAGGAPPGQ